MSKLRWTYAVTTVPERRDNLLPRTLESLRLAGFDKPILSVDDCSDPTLYAEFGFKTWCRGERIRTFGHWYLTALEMYIREPGSDRYAIFQDDFVTYKNLRDYLDSCEFPDKGYWNLFTFRSNLTVCPQGHKGWYKSNQSGRGAVALIFNRDSLITLLSGKHMVERPQHPTRGHKAVDGGIVETMKKAGYTEYVHNPSLTQHTGEKSTMQNPKHNPSPCFEGEGFDAHNMIGAMKTLYV